MRELEKLSDKAIVELVLDGKIDCYGEIGKIPV